MSFRPLMPVYSSDGALLEEDSWSERSANMANEYIRRFFERPEWLGWCRDAASGPLGQHVESLLANDEAEFLLFLDQVHIRPDTLDAPLRDDPSMPGLRRLLDSLYIGLAEAERIGGYLAAQSDRQATLDRQRRVLDGVHSLLTASDRERLRDVMRQAHGLDLDDPISTDIEPDGDGHRRELRILEALTLVETEASRNPNTRLRSAVIEWKNRNFHRLGFRDIEDLVIRYHGTEIVVNIAKCREIAANPGKFFPEWKTTQPFLGFVQTLRTAIEGSSMANAAKEAYARRAIALLKLDMAKLEQLISPDRPPVSAPAPTPAVVIALPEEVPADVPVVGVVRTSDAPVVEAPAEPLEAGEPAWLPVPEVPIEPVMAAPDGPTAPPESFDNSQDIAPVVATTPATAVVSAPSKRQKEIARRKARAGASGAATKPAPTARNVLPATAKPNPATPEVRVSLDYHSLSPSEKFAAVKSVLSLFVSVLTGWDTRRLGQGRVARDNRDMRNGTLRSFVTNMQMNKPMEAASAMFLLSKHLFTSHEQVASAFRCREIIFIAAKVCMRAWKGRLEQLSHDAGSSDILQALCVSEDELVGALRQLAAESKKRAIEKSGAAKPVTPLQSATITGQTPVEAPVLPDTSIGLPGIDELAKAPVPTDKRRPGELDYDSMSAQERLEAIDTVLSLFVQALRYKPARHERKAREAVLRSLVASLQKKSIPAISNAMLTLSGGVSAHAELRCPGILAVAVTTCGRAWQERVSRLTNNADSPAILSALAADTDELVRVCRGLMAELVSTTDQDGTADAATMVLADAGTIPEVSASEPLVESPAPVAGGTAVEGEPAPAPVATPTDHTAESGRAHIDAMIREICAILRDRSITNSNITKALRAAGISTAQVYDLYSLLHTQKFGTANLVSPKNPGFSRSWKRIENPTGLEACVEELFEDLLRAAA